MPDYRCTKYEKDLEVDCAQKEKLKCLLSLKHPKTNNHYSLIHQNEKPYKKAFAQIYNNKCAYCGISTDLLSLILYEIDHFIPKETGLGDTVNDISNLVLSCKACNMKKQGFTFTMEENQTICFPDNNTIRDVFARSDDFSIVVNKAYEGNNDVMSFYKKLNLGSQLKRLDYLLMSIIGLREYTRKIEKNDIALMLDDIFFGLKKKRDTITSDLFII